MQELAPIALFVYNRIEHVQKTLDSLSQNLLADKSDLYIFSDNAKSSDDISSVNKVRKFCSSLNNFKSITLYEREKNFGLARNIVNGISQVLENNKKIIVLEDDLLTDKFFLKYMNEALNLFENNEDIISIHGYIYPLKKKLQKPFFLKGADCWGWATWKRGWDLYNDDTNYLYNQIKNNNYQKEFNYNNSYNYFKILTKTLKSKNNSWTIKWYASAFLKKKLTLYPPHSLVHNIGNDGSGTNSSKNNIYDNYLKNIPIELENIPVIENSKLKNEFENYFNSKNNFIKKLINKFLIR